MTAKSAEKTSLEIKRVIKEPRARSGLRRRNGGTELFLKHEQLLDKESRDDHNKGVEQRAGSFGKIRIVGRFCEKPGVSHRCPTVSQEIIVDQNRGGK